MNRAPLILLVEDTPELREDLALELKEAGYRVTEAPDGETAIAAFRNDPPELVICDIQLPDMGGLSVLAAIRAGSDGDHTTPVIVVSAFSDIQLRNQANTLGVSAFLVKPIDHRSLLLMIAQCLGDAGLRP